MKSHPAFPRRFFPVAHSTPAFLRRRPFFRPNSKALVFSSFVYDQHTRLPFSATLREAWAESKGGKMFPLRRPRRFLFLCERHAPPGFFGLLDHSIPPYWPLPSPSNFNYAGRFFWAFFFFFLQFLVTWLINRCILFQHDLWLPSLARPATPS